MVTTFIYFFSAIGVLFALILVIYNWGINKNVVYLSFFLLILALEASLYGTFVFHGSITWYTFLFILSPVFYIKAPLLYFFVRGISHDEFYFKRTDLLHLIPFGIHLLVNIPYLLTSYEEKHQISIYLLQSYEHFKFMDINPLYHNAWNMILRPVQLLVYVIIAFYLLKKSILFDSGKEAQIHYQYVYVRNRLIVFLLIMLVITVIQNGMNYLFFVQEETVTPDSTLMFLAYLLMYFYFFIPVLFVLSPEMLYGLPRLEIKEASFHLNKKNKSSQKNENEMRNEMTEMTERS